MNFLRRLDIDKVLRPPKSSAVRKDYISGKKMKTTSLERLVGFLLFIIGFIFYLFFNQHIITKFYFAQVDGHCQSLPYANANEALMAWGLL